MRIWFAVAWSVRYILTPPSPPRTCSYSSAQDRFNDAIKSNARFYAIATIVSVFLIVLLSISQGSLNVLPLLMAIGNTYGLLLICLLLGYGLVDVPRKMYRKSNPEKELKRR